MNILFACKIVIVWRGTAPSPKGEKEIRKGCKLIDIIEVDNKAIEINIDPPTVDKTNLIIRAVAKGKPQFVPASHNGIHYNAIQVDNKMYIPDKYRKS